jgi:polyisoprenoid-binding protein YceI
MSRTVVLLAASLIFPRASFCGENYRIEPGQSAVTFSVRHMVLTTVHGKFTDFSGILELEDNDLSKSSVSVRINAASITTENAARDKDLRSANFLDTEKYPEITFVSHRVVVGTELFVPGNLAAVVAKLRELLPVFGHSAANPTNESALPAQVRRPYPSRARRCPS